MAVGGSDAHWRLLRDVLGPDGCWLAVTAPTAGLIEKLAGLCGLIAGEGFAINASKSDYFLHTSFYPNRLP
jgi:hypothetical protein